MKIKDIKIFKKEWWTTNKIATTIIIVILMFALFISYYIINGKENVNKIDEHSYYIGVNDGWDQAIEYVQSEGFSKDSVIPVDGEKITKIARKVGKKRLNR